MERKRKSNPLCITTAPQLYCATMNMNGIERLRFDCQNRRHSPINTSVRFLRLLLGVAIIAMFAQSLHAAATQSDLILSADTARPGDTIMAGVRLRMKPGWHTYWRNPGGSGIPTKITW